MTDKKNYKKAKSIIKNYEDKMNTHLCKERICCVCKENVVKPINPYNLNPLKQENGAWNGGVVEKITFGYGSMHDMESFFVAICDKCLIELEKEGLATNLRDIKNYIKNLTE